MVKPKKGNKKNQAVESDSDGDFVDPIKAAAEMEEDDPVLSLPAAPSKQKKTKAKKKVKKREDSDDEELEQKLKELAVRDSDEDTPQIAPKQNKKKKAKAAAPTAASAFSMLAGDSDSGGQESADDRSEDEAITISADLQDAGKSETKDSTVNGSEGREAEDDDLTTKLAALPADSGDEGKPSSKKDKKKKKTKKKGQQAAVAGEEDLDAILADLDKPTAEKPASAAKGKKKAAATVSSAAEQTEQAGEEELKTADSAQAEPEVKDEEAVEGEESAAAKKRRKKQKQKERKELEEAGVAVADQAEPVAGEEAAEEEEGDGEDSANKKKRKKKKDKKAGETTAEVADDKKKPKNKAIAAMKEALAKAKEDQERMEREEEEKIQKLEEAKRIKDEERKLKEEQRRKQREKDKERKEKKKQEGKLLTPAQKAERERALQMLAARGIEMPQPGEKPKKPYYGKPRKNKQPPGGKPKQQEESTAPAPAESKPTTETVSTDQPITAPPVAEVKDAWDAVSDTEVKDDWEAESETEQDKTIDSVADEKPAAKEADKQSTDKQSADKQEVEAKYAVVGSDGESEVESEEEESSSEESEDESSSEEEEDMTPRERALARIKKRQDVAEANKSTDKLRAPVVCVLGHVDTGKTKILDKLRRTNVQDGEAGGITQQIGATNVPLDAIHKQTSFVKDFKLEELKVPGLLIIDTPGHESFSNLRTRGSSLCDIAILVIDIMHGLEPQTIESIQLLKKGRTPFIVALNKIDRMYGWKPSPHQDVQAVIKKQTANTKSEFDERAAMVITQLAEQSLNAALFYDNPNPKEYISLVPTSAHSGDGMGNLIALLCQYSQTFLAKRVCVTDDLQCTVMEVKALPGLGTTVDVILVNGKLRNGDVVVMPGTEGPIVTHIRELLMPEPMKELRVKSQFRHHKEVEAAQGVKIVGKDLDKVLAGLPMYVAKYQDEVEVYKEWISSVLKKVLNAIKLSSTGVFVQASTLGSMEALLEYLRSVKVPYAGINIGPIHKKDVMKASVMVEHGEPQYATILAFDVKVERDATELADSVGVKIFTADIIYHLFDAFTKYQDELIEKGRRENNHLKIFPCKIRILPQFIFNSRDPIIMGVCIESGFLSNGTPICVPSKEFTNLGIVTSIERENKPVEKATKGMEVCIKIENLPGQAPRLYGRHFDESDMLVSKISRESIDAVKKYWKKDMSKDDWRLIIELKNTFEIL